MSSSCDPGETSRLLRKVLALRAGNSQPKAPQAFALSPPAIATFYRVRPDRLERST